MAEPSKEIAVPVLVASASETLMLFAAASFVAVPAFPVVLMEAVPLNFVASRVEDAVNGVIVLEPRVIVPDWIFASVMPYPATVVGLSVTPDHGTDVAEPAVYSS